MIMDPIISSTENINQSQMQFQFIKLILILCMLNLIGCINQVYRPPLDISTIPNDCGNKNSIIAWLDRQAAIPQQYLESKEDYERSRGQIRSRIWSLRYHCQPV
jgi:hypothetical protein